MRIQTSLVNRCLALVLIAGTLLTASETFAGTASIFRTWWSNQVDNDNDKCWAPESAGESMRLNWDVDVLGGGSVEVYEKIYVRATGSFAWDLLLVTPARTISGSSTTDAQYVPIAPTGTCAARDYLIEVYETGIATPVDTRSPANDPYLAGHSEESFADDVPPAIIYTAWWTQTTDRDQDGCWAPESQSEPMRLNWDADVAGGGSLNVFEKIYMRPAGAAKWTLFATTQPHTITGNNTLDSQHLDVQPNGDCQAIDYKIELYRSGFTSPDYVRDPSNDPALASHKEELFAQDNGPVIADAWWTNVSDNNADGCWATAEPGGKMRLNWDPNVAGGGTAVIYEQVYRKPTSSANWELIFTSSRRTISGTVSNDVQTLDIAPGTNCVAMDYKIELIEAGVPLPNYTRGPSNDADLSAHKEQLFNEDNTLSVITSVWWSDVRDKDGDGCFAPDSARGLIKLNWNPDVVGVGAVTVFEKVYWRSAGSSSWTVAATVPPHVINGSDSSDAQSVSMYPGENCSAYDYRIELYRTGTASPDSVMDAANTPTLSGHKEETLAQDSAAGISGAWWTQVADNDRDGCIAPAVSGGLMRLNWTPALLGAGTLDVFEKVYRRNPKALTWTLLAITQDHPVTTTPANQFLDVQASAGCTSVEYQIEIYRAGQPTPDAVFGPAEDPDLAARNEESWSEDNLLAGAGVSWANTADNNQNGCVAPASRGAGLQLRWNIDVVDNSTQSIFEKVYRKTTGDWVLLATTPVRSVTGTSTTDGQQLDIQPGSGCANTDYKIEVYRSGATFPELVMDGNTSSALKAHKEETFEQDNPTVAITKAWWSNTADSDGDGCFAPLENGAPMTLNWNPVLQGQGSFTVYEKIYRRVAGGTWDLLNLTGETTLASGETNVTHSVNLAGSGGCMAFDYRIEIYRSGQLQPEFVRDSSNDPSLLQRKEETYSEDHYPVQLLDAWWTNIVDNNGNGCYAPATSSRKIRLMWDADVLGNSSTLVYGKVYWREAGTTPWTLLGTNTPYLITGNGSSDFGYMDLPEAQGCAVKQYKLELYRWGDTAPSSELNPQKDVDLAALVLESYAEENNLATVFNVWWSKVADEDSDGCIAADNQSNIIRLNWDPDASKSGTLSVFEEVYFRKPGTTNWTLIDRLPPHDISGTSGTDTRYLDIQAGTGCIAREYEIRIYRVGSDEPDFVRNGSNDPLLAGRTEESYTEDHALPTFARIWWTDTADRNADGCVAPATAAGTFKLNWDADVSGPGTQTLFTKVYSRLGGSTNWTLMLATPPTPVTGATNADAMSIELAPLGNCNVHEYRLELYRQGSTVPDVVKDPSNEPILSQREQTFAQDPGLAPLIGAQPLSTAADAGASVTFAVTATGTAPLHYQWYFQSTNLLAGQTSPTLTLQKVRAEDAGPYTVVVTNAFGSVTSASAVLTIKQVTIPTLSTPQLMPNGAFQFTISGSIGSVYDILNSADLGGWKSLMVLTNTTGKVVVTHTNATSPGFYRVQVKP